MSRKKKAIQKLRDIGYDQETIDWFEKRSIKTIEAAVSNEKTLETIEKAAKSAAKKRTN